MSDHCHVPEPTHADHARPRSWGCAREGGGGGGSGRTSLQVIAQITRDPSYPRSRKSTLGPSRPPPPTLSGLSSHFLFSSQESINFADKLHSDFGDSIKQRARPQIRVQFRTSMHIVFDLKNVSKPGLSFIIYIYKDKTISLTKYFKLCYFSALLF